MAPPKAVIWDIGNVLLDWSPHHLYRRLIPDDAARAGFFERLGVDEMNLAGDRNGSLQKEVEALADRHPEDAALILPWWAGWDRMCAGLLDDSVALRDDLRDAGVACWALSNFAADTWARAEARYPALIRFDGLVISGREGAVKPDERIYELLEARVGLSGDDLFFIDDREENIEAATARGWRGHLFSNAADLRAELSGLSTPGA
ncbi:MAG: HAD family phosphatase [Pseudomonadota bacterium]